MLFASSRRRSLIGPIAALPAALLLSTGLACAQGQPARPKSPEPKPAEARPAETKPTTQAKPAEAPAKPAEAIKPSESAMKPGDMLKSPNDPIVAIVEGHMIYLSDVGRAVPQLPDNLRGLPFDTLFPVVVERLIDHQALVALARRMHLEEDPDTRREIDAATDRIMEGALLGRAAMPAAAEDNIQARYTQQYVGRPATEEARARHILVSTEAEAKSLIVELNKGADFPTLAQKRSKDPDGANGGDLGFFRRDQVWPEFADAAFALQPGQFSQAPIHNEFGWHVIKVEERRIVAPPTYSEVHDALRKELLQDAVQKTIDEARAQLTIRKYNVDGTPMGVVPDITPVQPMVKQEDTAPKPQ
jgi:peptidyl-prolyl cis-trans isomerase C